MPAPIALQLYTLREAMNEDFPGTIEKVAEMGYVGVETAGFPGTNAPEAAKLFQDLGLTVSSVHAPLPLGDQKNEVLDTMAALKCQYLVSPFMPPSDYETVAGIKKVADQFNEANAVAKENGLQFGIHNHWWEFLIVEGQPAYKYLVDYIDSEIFFEIDTYWVQTGGPDPVAVVKELGQRVPLLHIKDGPADTNEPQKPMVAAGEGVLDFPAIVEASQGIAEWLIIELDHCTTDMVGAVQKSYTYLVGEGLARGNKS